MQCAWGLTRLLAAPAAAPACCAAQDFAGGNIVGARNVPTKGVWLQDEGPGGAVDKARALRHTPC
jgi:hypothetical protein